jgi:hypothetical protein
MISLVNGLLVNWANNPVKVFGGRGVGVIHLPLKISLNIIP